ncbi:LPS translocon maturation chaperone LptM [Tepidicella baoligensis]|uniref:LPS translocon maturation chaperone LptM n=1 Tax=Tepidicella baoligensis TaxID=2707016 RepID=UPI0015DAD14E
MFHRFQIVGTPSRATPWRRLARAGFVGMALLFVGLGLTACGQKGPLYLPAPDQPAQPPDAPRR